MKDAVILAKERLGRDDEDPVRLYLTDIGQYPLLTKDDEVRLAQAIEAVLSARAAHPEASLADLYDPISMPPALVHAHDSLDKAVDTAFAPRRRFTGDSDRLALLFERYQQLTAPLLPPAPRVRRRVRSV